MKSALLTLFFISVLLVNGLFTFQLGDHGDTKLKWVEHTHNVILETEIFLGALKDLETGQRGYLLTHDENYLEPYTLGLVLVEQSFLKLSQLTLDNPIQQKRLSSIHLSMNLKLEELLTTINLVKLANNNKALQIVKDNEGKQYMDDIRLILNTFITEETRLLSLRKNELQAQTDKNIFMVRAISIILLAILFFFIYRTQNQKYALKIANLKALDALDTKSEFLANMSHEIRTPLNAILGFINLIKVRLKDQKAIEYLSIIDSSSKSLLHIIEDILDFSKIESGKLEIDKIDFNTKEEFEIITHLFDAKCSEKDITLILNLQENIPPFLNTDPFRIKQVISNLLSNAIKFTDAGKGIEINMFYKDACLHVAVIDKGKGIAQNKQSHIFTAFAQEDSSTTRNYGGTGLGLSISNDLVKLLGGELSLQSKLGEGSTFSFYIPASIANELTNETKPEQDFELKGEILLVEDNKTNQLLMQIMIDELGLEFDLANDGLEAVEKFKKKKFDVILMDENMPNMGGIEATSIILSIEKEKNLEHTPIIALTANALKGDRKKFLDAGMDEYRTKPLDKQVLSEVLHQVMKKS